MKLRWCGDSIPSALTISTQSAAARSADIMRGDAATVARAAGAR